MTGNIERNRINAQFAFAPLLTTWGKLAVHRNTPWIHLKTDSSPVSRVVAPIANCVKKALIYLAYALSTIALALFSIASLPFRICKRKPSALIIENLEDAPPSPSNSYVNTPRTHQFDFHYLFISKVYGTYVTKLKTEVNHMLKYRPAFNILKRAPEFQIHTFELINLIQSLKISRDEEYNRQSHQDVICKLRSLIEEKHKLPPGQNHPGIIQSIDFIEKLSEFIYVGTNLTPEISQFLDDLLPKEAKKEFQQLPVSAIPNWIKKWHVQLSCLPKFKGIFEVPRLYDPRLLGDVPTVLYEYPLAGKRIKIIRTPTVVKDERRNEKGFIDKASVVKEFQGFLDSYRKQNKKHLYVNLMEREGGRSETARTSCIENLENEYTDHLHVISLAKNSEFYFQIGYYKAATMEYSDFKGHFLREMFDNPITYRWPTTLGKDWQNKCMIALDTVHKRHFCNRTVLSLEERKDFIEIAYTEIVEAAMDQLQPDSCNISCLSCIDRAAAMLSEQFLKTCMKHNQPLHPLQRKHMVTIALAPAILAQNRLMQHDRMDRLHTATQRMLA